MCDKETYRLRDEHPVLYTIADKATDLFSYVARFGKGILDYRRRNNDK
jgi:hypothetical protein